MPKQATPEWISEKAAAEWLGVSIVTLWRMRKKDGLNYTYVNGTNRGLMYDKNQLNEILYNNSTYKLTA